METADQPRPDVPGEMVEKVRVVETFIAKVGMPSLIILVLLGLLVASLLGYVDPPIVTRNAFHEHVISNDRIHEAMIKNATANTEVLRQITEELRDMRQGINCDRKRSDSAKLQCYQSLAEPTH